MCSSFSSDLHSLDAGGETDSDIEWITPETALMGVPPMRVRPLPPLFAPPGYKSTWAPQNRSNAFRKDPLNRAMSSAAHTEYDNAESERGLSDGDSHFSSRQSHRAPTKQKRKRWFSRERDGCDADMESQCSSMASSVEIRSVEMEKCPFGRVCNPYSL
ncbi:unnamed protein product, partial [Mesorhabditis spiculigera]